MDQLQELATSYKDLSREQLAEKAVEIATRQIMATSEFKRSRLIRLCKYHALYNGEVPKKIRQLFNVPIPVFAGMIDTLNAEHNTSTRINFKEGDPADYFKVQKLNGAFQMEVMDNSEDSKWDEKLYMVRKHAIIDGVGIPKLTTSSDPNYRSELAVTKLKDFNFQPRGGSNLENHLFAGEEDIERTQAELVAAALSGEYDRDQVRKLISSCSETDYLPFKDNYEWSQSLERFKPFGLNPDNHNYVGQPVYKLAQHILEIGGKRYFLVFHPWTRTWVRFEKWSEISSSELYPWAPVHTHPDDENFLSKSFADDLYPAADAIVAMFNQELTNRERRNNTSRAYDKDMFKDVRKLDEASYRPDALVPADTAGGTKQIAQGIYEFKIGELGGTVNLIDWVGATVGRQVGATDTSQGSTADASKKASVVFTEQKAISKRLAWSSTPFKQMNAALGTRYKNGLIDHMPARMAIRILGERGLDWDEITRMDLKFKKDVDVLVVTNDQSFQDSELEKQARKDGLTAIGADPALASVIGPQWRAAELLSAAGYDDAEIAAALDIKTYSDKRSLARAAEAIQLILQGKKPPIWYGADAAFMQKIVDVATDRRTTLGPLYDTLIDYALEHEQIAMQNTERKAVDDARTAAATGSGPQPKEQPSNIPGGISRAMNMAEATT